MLPGSADSGIADQAEISPEMRVLQEVMDTETVYVADLEEVIEVSFKFCRNFSCLNFKIDFIVLTSISL